MWCPQHGTGWSPFGISDSTVWSKPGTHRTSFRAPTRYNVTKVETSKDEKSFTVFCPGFLALHSAGHLFIATVGKFPVWIWVALRRKIKSHLVGALNTPHIGTLPSQIAFSAVIISVLLFQKLMEKRKVSESSGNSQVGYFAEWS